MAVGTITFKTVEEKILWEHEIKGQISDGAWENAYPRNHWSYWCNSKSQVGEDVGRDFPVSRVSYGLMRACYQYIGNRMRAYVAIGKACPDLDETAVDDLATFLEGFDGESLVELIKRKCENNAKWFLGNARRIRNYLSDEDIERVGAIYKSTTKKDVSRVCQGISKAMKTYKG